MLQLGSTNPVITNLRSRFQFASYFRRDKESGSFESLKKTLTQILSKDLAHQKFLLLGSGTHANGIFYKAKTFYFYDPAHEYYIAPISIDDPNWAEKLVINLTEHKTIDAFPLSINVLSDSPLEETETLGKDLDLDIGDLEGTGPLHLVSSKGYLQMMEALLQKDANIDQFDSAGKTPLILALDMNNVDMVKALLEKGAKVDKPSSSGFTPLILAIHRFNNVELVKTLLEKADHTITDVFDKTALEHAIEVDNQEIVTALLEKGASLEDADMYEQTPLIYTIKNGSVKMMEFLIEKGVNINQSDASGNPPLIHAIRSNKPEMLEALLKKGADVNKPGQYGKTPLQYAKEENNPEIMAALQKWLR
jgi:ankyrin repeat protein